MRRLWATLDFIREHERVAIVGGPVTGKSTLLALIHDRHAYDTDTLKHLAWGEVSERVIVHLGPHARFVVAGVRAAHALRKGLVVDGVVYLDTPFQELSPGQLSMTKAVATVFQEWRNAHPEVDLLSPDLPPS